MPTASHPSEEMHHHHREVKEEEEEEDHQTSAGEMGQLEPLPDALGSVLYTMSRHDYFVVIEFKTSFPSEESGNFDETQQHRQHSIMNAVLHWIVVEKSSSSVIDRYTVHIVDSDAAVDNPSDTERKRNNSSDEEEEEEESGSCGEHVNHSTVHSVKSALQKVRLFEYYSSLRNDIPPIPGRVIIIGAHINVYFVRSFIRAHSSTSTFSTTTQCTRRAFVSWWATLCRP